MSKTTPKEETVAPKKTESKHDRFVRLAEGRTDKVIYYLRVLRNLSSQAHYEYSQKEIEKIFRTIDSELRKTKKSFKKAPAAKKGSKFSLS